MILLALETSTARASLSLTRDDEVLGEWEFRSDRAHNARLFQPLEAALGVADPDLIAVGTGPGSYAGIRVSIAAALGICMARHLPLIGWPSLTAFDAPPDGWVIGDARRGGYFLAQLAEGRLVHSPRIVARDELDQHAADQISAGQRVWTFDEIAPIAAAERAFPSARWLARRVLALSAAERNALAATTPEPIYLRAPFITSPRSNRNHGLAPVPPET